MLAFRSRDEEISCVAGRRLLGRLSWRRALGLSPPICHENTGRDSSESRGVMAGEEKREKANKEKEEEEEAKKGQSGALVGFPAQALACETLGGPRTQEARDKTIIQDNKHGYKYACKRQRHDARRTPCSIRKQMLLVLARRGVCMFGGGGYCAGSQGKRCRLKLPRLNGSDDGRKMYRGVGNDGIVSVSVSVAQFGSRIRPSLSTKWQRVPYGAGR
jgi:hypothetical protein